MNAPRTVIKTFLFLSLGMIGIAALGCAAGGPFAALQTSQLDDRELDPEPPSEQRGPIRLVSFPQIDVLPLWPTRDEASESAAAVKAPFAAGASAVKRGMGQVQQGFVQLGTGTRRAWTTTSNYLTRPFVAVRATPGEPSLLQRMFWSQPENDGPRTTREFFEQERLR